MHGGGGIFGFEAYGGERAPIKPGPSLYGRAGFEPYGSEMGLGVVPGVLVERAREVQQAERLQGIIPLLAVAGLLFFLRRR